MLKVGWMTEEELEKIITEMQEMFGENFPNPEQEPVRFKTYVTWYKFYKERKSAAVGD